MHKGLESMTLFHVDRTVVAVAVFSAIHGGNLPWIAYAVPGLVALLGLAMMVVRFRI